MAVAMLLMTMEIIGFLLTLLQWDNIMELLLTMTGHTMFMVACRIIMFGLARQTMLTMQAGKAVVTIHLNLWWVVMECRWRWIQEIIQQPMPVHNLEY